MPGDLLSGRLPVPGDLPLLMTLAFTVEQRVAIGRRDGDLLLDANAGSGKTSVLVERFVRSVLDDGVDVSAILVITFTDKAAAELRDRIRVRLRELGEDETARATEGAFISTIHGFCARVLRAHALSAGIDPAFVVLDEPTADRLADSAFDAALEDLAQGDPGGVDLIARYGVGTLRGAILALHAELRSRGQSTPALPRPPVPPDLTGAREALERARAGAALELAALPGPPAAKVMQALGRLERCADLPRSGLWPADLEAVRLPGANGACLAGVACVAYSEALERFRAASEIGAAVAPLERLDQLLAGHGAHYAARKRELSGLDFEDLELMTRDLLASSAELRGRYASRFAQIMVDELQDTNPVQLELIESIATGNLFTVGDALQSIYGFRHADVELFEARGERLADAGARATLTTNFRSRPEILAAVNLAFGAALGDRFAPLVAGRDAAPGGQPVVELLIADKGADWAKDGIASPWRMAEARALASRVDELISAGAGAGEIVLLTRASTDLRAYERALEDRGVPTYVIGGRGYWSHPQVVDLLAYLRALANPRDEEAFYTVLASPLVGVSADALVLIGADGRARGRDPWWVLREPGEGLAGLEASDRRRLLRFADWFAAERAAAPRLGIEALIDRALGQTGYDLTILALPGGERRLANVNKLMRLGREYEADRGSGLRGFLDLVRSRASERAGASRESEAPVEGEALDAVRLMTIHRAKGLEFPIVCVADLGRGPRWRAELVRIGRDGRVGLRLAQPGTGRLEPALHYDALGAERFSAEAAEERRLFYVAMTRAQERLILSGAAKLDPWTAGAAGGPISWIAPAFVPDVGQRVAAGETESVVERAEAGGHARVALSVLRPAEGGLGGSQLGLGGSQIGLGGEMGLGGEQEHGPEHLDRGLAITATPPLVPSLSYSSLGEYARCGYRFYLERVLGLPRVREFAPAPGAHRLTGAERGVLAHALLERLDFRRPVRPGAAALATAAQSTGLLPAPEDAEEVSALVEAFGASSLCGRLARASDVRREERFAFGLGPTGTLMTGVLDVLAREPGGRMLIVDYKSDRLQGIDLAEVVARDYASQRLVYAVAALEAGAGEVEIAHTFLELPDRPVLARFAAGELPALRDELNQLARGVLVGEFVVSSAPCRTLCHGCPGEGGLCSWPIEVTRREAVDRLF